MLAHTLPMHLQPYPVWWCGHHIVSLSISLSLSLSLSLSPFFEKSAKKSDQQHPCQNSLAFCYPGQKKLRQPRMPNYSRARACSREHAPVLQSARLSHFFFFGQVVKGLLSSWANRGALLWKISKWSEIFFLILVKWEAFNASLSKTKKKEEKEKEEN